ncbi:alkaline phosphatase D family protein [Ruania alba]|nr:alkaline phosphatase D family protein [Ruania alba]
MLLGTGAWDSAAAAPHTVGGYPFTLGVASGDPQPDGVVLWTRLAPEPLAPDGRGGMPERVVPVRYEVAADEQFRRIVRRGVAHATPRLGHSVHPEIHGLEPGREYWYRFFVANHASPVGRTKTAPPPGSTPSLLKFGFGSCQSYEAGHYTTLKHLAEEDLDLFVHLGDYIYEESYVENPVFHHNGEPLYDYLLTECFDLPRYRLQYALYKMDEHLQAAHAQFPWVHTFDDHEVENNWWADNSQRDNEPDQDPVIFRQRKAAAFQAMYENLPLRQAQMPNDADIRIHRKLQYGTLAEFTMLDTRQYRTSRSSRTDPNSTMLGGRQRDWLIDSLTAGDAQWKIIGNQVPMVQVDRDPDEEVEQFFMDGWDAYVAERDNVLSAAHEHDAENIVVLTGDRHSNYISELKTNYDDPDSPSVGTEIVGTSLSSNRDGADMLPVGEDYLKTNPHLKFVNFQRGYSRITVTRDELQNDFRVVEKISEPDYPISTRATFAIEDGVVGAHRV